MNFYISEGFIIIGYFIFFISRFRKTKKSILITDTVSRICFIVGYCLINSVNSIQHTVYGIIRNIVGQVLVPTKKIYKILGFIIMLIALCVMYGLSFNSVSTIMFMLSGMINLFMVIFAKEQGIRLGTILASICNITAFLMVGSYASVIGEMLCGIISILSYMRGNKKNEEMEFIRFQR